MDKAKIRRQIKEYQKKVSELRSKLKAAGVIDEGGVSKLNNAIVKGGPSLKQLVAQGHVAQGNRKNKGVDGIVMSGSYAGPSVTRR
jgi:hypothetical protein